MVIIDGIDFEALEAEKYWSFPAKYKGNPTEEIKLMIMSNLYGGARKMDGAYYRLLKDMEGNIRLQSRSESVNGGYLDKHEWVPQLNDFFKAVPNGSVLLGEVYFPQNEGSRHVTTIMGCTKDKAIARQENAPKLHYYIFDVWAWNGVSYMKMNAEDRFNFVSTKANHSMYDFPYVEWAMYYIGPALWDELTKVRCLNGEGIVITKLDSIPSPGKRTARKTLKIKRELDNPIDCFLTGKYRPATMEYKGGYIEEWNYWLNNRTGEKIQGNYYTQYRLGEPIIPVTKAWYYGWASAVEIGLMENGREVGIGWISGITDDVKQGIVENPDKYRHKVVKINAMEVMQDTKALRHGRIIEWRADDDKIWSDCDITQIL